MPVSITATVHPAPRAPIPVRMIRDSSCRNGCVRSSGMSYEGICSARKKSEHVELAGLEEAKRRAGCLGANADRDTHRRQLLALRGEAGAFQTARLPGDECLDERPHSERMSGRRRKG